MQMTKFWTVYIIRFVSIFFVVSVIIASYFFPGGNIHNPDQIGYSFSHNFLSELGGYITFAGDINSISSFFFNPSAKAPIVNATVPLDNVIAYFLFEIFASCFENSSFVFPGPKKFDFN